MNKKRKTAKWIKSIVIVTIILTSIFGLIKISGLDQAFMYMQISLNDSKVENFQRHNEDYQLITDKIVKLRDEGKISKEDNYVFVEEGIMYDGDSGAEIPLTANEKTSLLNIENTFDKENYPMTMIRVYDDNYIAFSVSEYPFGVVYAENGMKPNSLGLNDEKNEKYKVRKLALNWYSVEAK